MNSEGIGLGLMISKGLVESNGGQLKFSSNGLGKGTQFMFAMRMNRDSHSSEAEKSNSSTENIELEVQLDDKVSSVLQQKTKLI